MTTKLEGPLRRELELRGDPYTLTITPDGLSLVPKGKRNGYALDWLAFINGDAALAVALNASLANAPASTTASKASGQTVKLKKKARASGLGDK